MLHYTLFCHLVFKQFISLSGMKCDLCYSLINIIVICMHISKKRKLYPINVLILAMYLIFFYFVVFWLCFSSCCFDIYPKLSESIWQHCWLCTLSSHYPVTNQLRNLMCDCTWYKESIHMLLPFEFNFVYFSIILWLSSCLLSTLPHN